MTNTYLQSSSRREPRISEMKGGGRLLDADCIFAYQVSCMCAVTCLRSRQNNLFLLKPVQFEIFSTKALFFQTILKHCPTAKVTFWHVTRTYALFTLAGNANTIYLYIFVDVSSCWLLVCICVIYSCLTCCELTDFNVVTTGHLSAQESWKHHVPFCWPRT